MQLIEIYVHLSQVLLIVACQRIKNVKSIHLIIFWGPSRAQGNNIELYDTC